MHIDGSAPSCERYRANRPQCDAGRARCRAGATQDECDAGRVRCRGANGTAHDRPLVVCPDAPKSAQPSNRPVASRPNTPARAPRLPHLTVIQNGGLAKTAAASRKTGPPEGGPASCALSRRTFYSEKSSSPLKMSSASSTDMSASVMAEMALVRRTASSSER